MIGQKAPDEIRVVTLNLWGQSGPWERRRAVLIDGLRDVEPDLIASQEAVSTDDYDQVVDVMGSDMHVVHARSRQAAGPGIGSGISIATQWAVKAAYEFDLPRTDRVGEFPATTLAVEVDVPGAIGRVLFVNHLPAWELDQEFERGLQAVSAARCIDELVGGRPVHVVMAGDLDADPDASSIRFWTGRHALDGLSVCYRDAWESAHPGEPGHTFTPRNALMAPYAPDWPFRRIDYIFVRCAEHAGSTLEIRRCELLFDEPVGGTWATDHIGVVADLAPRTTAVSSS